MKWHLGPLEVEVELGPEGLDAMLTIVSVWRLFRVAGAAQEEVAAVFVKALSESDTVSLFQTALVDRFPEACGRIAGAGPEPDQVPEEKQGGERNG